MAGGYQYENNVLKFFPHAEGYVIKEGTSTYKHVFNYTDHLGNIRLKYCDLNLNGTIESNEILEENHYYPFGMKHERYNEDSSVLANKYKYNGKEWQDELGLNFYDYHARNYDPAIGRWMNIDPLAENSRRWTPYNYAYNNPIYFIDPDGMQAEASQTASIYYDWNEKRYIDKSSGESSNVESALASLNEEPPINLFQKRKGSKDKVGSEMNSDKIEQVYANLHNDVVESRDYEIGDGIFTVYAHGTYDGAISDRREGWRNKKLIYDVKELNKLLMEISPEWNKVMSKPESEREQITLYLFACSSGDSKNSIAARFSAVYKNVTVAGFSDKATMGKRTYSDGSVTYGVFGVNNNGNVIYYNNGKRLKSIPFQEYLKTKPLNAIEQQKK
ncbi:RHS repeat-associated core domain-containing protein [Flavobacterium azooxidireducens]|uniref:RHS repeat-associated core domain-containing protein n=1 Tax=Flavobacterium azooxidireducens TaxID=1871076 RepID=A0ABY4KI18_9FLAO|nr:RHS repeat-associated core domain-containing protein [Flavobacterium azooxidireducens]UPQ80462.1 RHS repeat-associated core domain-containing protein [Flavobacterium azooxidireducens]